MQGPAVVPKGTVYDFPVISLDIFPTAMAFADVDSSLGKPLDGVDPMPSLTGRSEGRPHQSFFWKNGPSWAVRDWDLKLIVGDNTIEEPDLFDLGTEFAETKNLAPTRPDDTHRMQ